ncbi:hypothetical protein BD626DRAFT_237068 [Schizophyllum amplum]|uniref:Uncharacterized protein n=1 Tax=Schizophyllum amplum TaxID=97359 RepID=A0A550CJE3_9AGAR|nr:hypothetical protein BD626DRAFT_237068 [Auriculariopsis ampla]
MDSCTEASKIRNNKQPDSATVSLPVQRTFPPEILGIIFHYYMQGVRLRLNYREPVWVLTRVCHLWRGVAFDNWLLWTRIDASLSRIGSKSNALLPTPSETDRCLSILKRYLEYSRKAPLDIYVDLEHCDVCPVILRTLWEHRPRWQKAYVADYGIDASQACRDVRGQLGYGMPNLQYIQLLGAPDVLAHMCPAPALRTLVVGADFRGNLPNDNPVWSQITCYSGPAFFNSHDRRSTFILARMPNLEICDITGVGRQLAYAVILAPRARCKFHRLQVLRLGRSQCDVYLPLIDAPRLRKLDCRQDTMGYSAVHSFLRQCGSSLSLLSVKYGVDDKRLYEIIQQVPTLHTLILHDEASRENEYACSGDIFALLASNPKALSDLAVLKVERLRERYNKPASDSFVVLVRSLATLYPLRLQTAALCVPSDDIEKVSHLLRDECTCIPSAVHIKARDLSKNSLDEEDMGEVYSVFADSRW